MGRDVLARLIKEREAAVASLEAIVSDAETENRADLTEAEETSAKELRGRIERLDKSIDEWGTIVERTGKVEELQRKFAEADANLPAATEGRAIVTREDPVYRPDGERSFFADHFRATRGNVEAREMLARHAKIEGRALNTSDDSAVVPPQYLAAMFAPDAKYGAPVASSFPQYPLRDARSFDLPRQLTASTVGTQSAENANVSSGEPTFDKVTVTPATKAGEVVMSRQILDGSDPSIDLIVANDLRGELLEQAEAVAVATLEGTTNATTATPSGNAGVLLDAIVAGIVTVYGDRHQPADTIYVKTTDYGKLVAAKDTTGRPLLNAYAPSNAPGMGETRILETEVHGVRMVVSPAITATKVIVARRADFGFFSSPALQFRYDEVSGPESIKVGIWQYQAAVTSRYPKGVHIITWTEA